MICILYICLHCTYIHINSSEHEWQMCGWINNVHTVFTLSVVKYLVMLFFLPSTPLTPLFCLLISSSCFLLYLPLIHFLPSLPCFHSPLSWYSWFRPGASHQHHLQWGDRKLSDGVVDQTQESHQWFQGHLHPRRGRWELTCMFYLPLLVKIGPSTRDHFWPIVLLYGAATSHWIK